MLSHGMNVWGWIVLYVVVFSLLQLLIYRYLRSDDDSPLLHSTPPGAEQVGAEDVPAVEDVRNDRVLDEFGQGDDSDRHDGDSDLRRCPHCGTENRALYTYCRDCVEPLGVW